MNLVLPLHDVRTDGAWRPPLLPSALVYVLFLQNIFNGGSVFVTFALNISTLLYCILRANGRVGLLSPAYVACVFFVFMWLLVIVFVRGDYDNQVILKYGRNIVATTLLAAIFAVASAKEVTVVRALMSCFALHVLLIYLQIIFPSVTDYTAPFFGFNRESEILSNFSLRKLGASSSYDTAALLSVIAMIFFALAYFSTGRLKFLIALAFAFGAGMFSSRLGIVSSLVVAYLMVLFVLLHGSTLQRVVALIVASIVTAFGIQEVLPIIEHSFGIGSGVASGSRLFSDTDYGTTGTLDALVGEHLIPLDQSLGDLLLGHAFDPNAVGIPSDIGYVKLIYHIGLVGTITVVTAHLLIMLSLLNIRKRMPKSCSMTHDILNLAIAVGVLLLIFNYKSLELFSRGVADLFLILYLYCRSTYRREHA